MKYLLDDFFTKKLFLLHIFLPIAIGSLIYIFLREDNILVFQIFKLIGVYEIIDTMRNATMTYREVIPEWIYYSLPDGLWVYSLNVFCLLFTGYYLEFKNSIFSFIGIFLGLGSEIFQYFKLIPGTFDILDLIICFLGVVFAFITYSFRKKYYLKEYIKKIQNKIT